MKHLPAFAFRSVQTARGIADHHPAPEKRAKANSAQMRGILANKYERNF